MNQKIRTTQTQYVLSNSTELQEQKKPQAELRIAEHQIRKLRSQLTKVNIFMSDPCRSTGLQLTMTVQKMFRFSPQSS